MSQLNYKGKYFFLILHTFNMEIILNIKSGFKCEIIQDGEKSSDYSS